MREIQALVAECRAAAEAGLQLALATVVNVEGSAYRRPGVRMLVRADGTRMGTLSGGCLEADVAERALRMLETGVPRTVRYDSRSGFDPVAEMGCNGALTILLEPVTPAVLCSLEFLLECQHERHTGVLATVFRAEGDHSLVMGERLMGCGTEIKGGERHAPSLISALQPAFEAALQERRARVQTLTLTDTGTEISLLIEPVQPPVHLTLCGAGHDALPLAQMASLLGWKVTVVDHRDFLLTSERFPEGVCLVPEQLRGEMCLDERTAVVVMTHSLSRDREWLPLLLASPVRYIGVLGPRKRAEQLRQELREEGYALEETQRARLHTPTGLDLGAETAEEIALSVIAEIQAVFQARSGGFLRDRPGPIHAQTPTERAVISVGELCPVLA